MTTTGLQNGHKPLVFKKSFRPTPKMYDAVQVKYIATIPIYPVYPCILGLQSFDVEFIVAPIKIVIEMECLGIVMPIYGHAYHYVFTIFLYRKSDCGTDKKELVVIYEVSKYKPIRTKLCC